jgi:hypothetical protein
MTHEFAAMEMHGAALHDKEALRETARARAGEMRGDEAGECRFRVLEFISFSSIMIYTLASIGGF